MKCHPLPPTRGFLSSEALNNLSSAAIIHAKRYIMFYCSRRLGAASIGALLALLAYSYQPSLAQAPASNTVALIGARVIDGTGQPPLDQATILVVNGRIESV